MKVFTAQLFALASSLSALALEIRTGAIPQSPAGACPSAQVLSSLFVTVDDLEIVHQVLSCPDGDLTAPAIPYLPTSSVDNKRSAIEARGVAECTTSAAECQCGQPATCNCIFTATGGAVPGDCAVLIEHFPIISIGNGPTFIVQPGMVHTASFATCTASFTNLNSVSEEYCWDDFQFLAGGQMGCIDEGGDPVCMAENQKFRIQLGAKI